MRSLMTRSIRAYISTSLVLLLIRTQGVAVSSCVLHRDIYTQVYVCVHTAVLYVSFLGTFSLWRRDTRLAVGASHPSRIGGTRMTIRVVRSHESLYLFTAALRRRQRRERIYFRCSCQRLKERRKDRGGIDRSILSL